MAKDWFHSHSSVNVELRLISERTNLRQYNAPTVAKVAALITNDFGDGAPTRDIIETNKDSGLQRILELHPSYMALQYPLLFPYGEDGYHDKISYHSNTGTRKTNRGYVTMKEYYTYVIQYKKDQGTTLLRGGRGDTNATGLGKRIVLSHTFTRSPRHMMQNYQDAIALCRAYGNPDLFITFTSNPKWPEINEMLAYVPRQRAHDRPELFTISNPYYEKLMLLLHWHAVVYVIEFQKRGLPHAHILLWLEKHCKCKTPDHIDDKISAELPLLMDDPVGYKAVTDYMLHGPCGKDARYVACNVEGNIMDGVDVEDLTIEQYLRLTQESQTPKKIEDMTIAEYLEYEKMMNMNHISNAKSYLPTYFGESTPTHDPILEFSHSFGPNQPGTKSDYDSKDLDEEVEYMTDDEVVMSEQEESSHRYTQNTQHLKEKDDVDKWLNVEITKHMTSVSNETSSIASKEVDKDDNNTSNTTSCQLPKELSPGSFLLPFNIDNHSFYAITTLDAKDNIMPLKVYKYLGLDKFRDLFSYESPACLEFEQRTRSYGTPNLQDEIAGPISFSPDGRGLVKRWHGTLRMWICFRDHERRTVKGSYMGFADFLQVRYGQQKIDDTTRERMIGHNNLHESGREFIFNEWILDNYDVEEEYAREIGNPYSRRFDEYNRVFNNEIEHLSNEYILRTGKKGYVLDDDEALPLGRVNGARFKAMIRKELEGNKYVHENPEARRQLSRPARLGIKSLREDRDNLIDFRQFSNLEAMLREFLVLIILFPYYFISLMYNRDTVQIK
ncbi:helicase [Tanacetum coccineum]